MGIISCKLTKERTAAINNKRERTYSRTYLVITDSAAEEGVIGAPGFSIDDPHPSDAGAICTNISAQCTDEDGKGWAVVVEFGPGEETPENPLDAPVKRSGGFNIGPEQPMDKDVNGKPVVNAAGDPFLEAITREEARGFLKFVRNEASPPVALQNAYTNAINRDSFQGAPRETVRCSGITWEEEHDKDYGTYYVVSYEFEFRPQGWKRKVLNAGLRELVAGKRKQILVQGNPVNDPVCLSRTGQKLNPGVPPIYLEFEPYQKLSFSAFGF